MPTYEDQFYESPLIGGMVRPTRTGRPCDRPAEPLTDNPFGQKSIWLRIAITLGGWSVHWTKELSYGMAVENDRMLSNSFLARIPPFKSLHRNARVWVSDIPPF